MAVDRSTRLTVSGLVSILVGGLCVLLGLLHLLLLSATLREMAGLEGLGVDPRSLLSGLLLYLALGVAFIWVGVGSVRRRRWASPLMSLLATTWLLGGLMALGLAWVALDVLLVGTAAADTPELAWAIRAVVLGVGAVVGVIAPALLIWVYRDPNMLRTCEAHDPKPAWTERCPLSVLGLSLGMGACAVLALTMLAQAVVPVFGHLVTGWPAALLVLAAAAACGYLAWATFRLRRGGWWGSLLLLVVSGASAAATFLRVDPLDYYRAMGYGEEQLELLSGFGRRTAVGSTAVLTLFSVVYMIAIRRHFGGPERDSNRNPARKEYGAP